VWRIGGMFHFILISSLAAEGQAVGERGRVVEAVASNNRLWLVCGRGACLLGAS